MANNLMKLQMFNNRQKGEHLEWVNIMLIIVFTITFVIRPETVILVCRNTIISFFIIIGKGLVVLRKHSECK